MMPRAMVAVLAIAALSVGQGCAAVGLTLFGAGAGTAAGAGVSYTMDSIAYKTFTTPVDTLQDATLATLDRMDMEVQDIEIREDQSNELGRKIVALAGDRTIEIELDRLTAKTTRMRVNAKRGAFLKDRATATEIIAQTERTLGREAPSEDPK